MRRLPEGLQNQLLDTYLMAADFIVLNVIWFVVSIPIITAFPALMGLVYTTNRLAHDKTINWRLFFEGFRTYFWLSFRWGLLNLIVVIVLFSNLLFYTQVTGDWVIWVRAIFITLMTFWLSLQMYVLPLLLEQEKPQLRRAFANSLVILIRRPVYTLWQALVIGIIAALSTFIIQPAWIVVSASLITYLANRSTINSIRKLAPTTTTEKASDSVASAGTPHEGD